MTLDEWRYLLELILRIFGAALVGAIIGYEREMKSKPAGFLTFTLVSVGSCLLAILQVNLALAANGEPDVVRVDSGRVLAGVIGGIGFIGAGVIMHDHGQAKGITTAALLWFVAALGMMIGTGGKFNYIVAGVTLIIVYPLANYLRKLSNKFANTKKLRRVRVVFEEIHEKELFDILLNEGIIIRRTILTNKYTQDSVHLKENLIYFSLPKELMLDVLVSNMSDLSYVVEFTEA